MKLTDLWTTSSRPTISCEVFAPPSPKMAANFDKALPKLAALRPDFFSVTFKSGGGAREGSRDLVRRLRSEHDAEVLAYFAGYGLGPDDVTAVLDGYRELGVENVLLVRGDEPREQPDFSPHPDSCVHASDLLQFVKPRYEFCLGAAGYPEGHVEAESLERDLEFIKLKVDRGAEFIIANYTYDTSLYDRFVTRCRDLGITVPILAGVMPIYSVKMMEMLAELCGATITDSVRQGLAALPPDDKQAVSQFGIDFATDQCRQLVKAGAPGLHLYTMNRAKAVVQIVETLRSEGLV